MAEQFIKPNIPIPAWGNEYSEVTYLHATSDVQIMSYSDYIATGTFTFMTNPEYLKPGEMYAILGQVDGITAQGMSIPTASAEGMILFVCPSYLIAISMIENNPM